MKVRYTEFCPDPKLRNTETHLQNHVAAVLIAQGVAVAVPFKTFADFLSSKNPPAVAVPVEWGVKEAGQYTPATVIKRTASGVTHYRTPPADCPASIVAQWKSLTDGAPEVPAYGPGEAVQLEALYRNGDSNQHRPVNHGNGIMSRK